MKILRFFPLFPALALYASALAQSASLTADSKALAPGGGTVVLTASATYGGQPAALAWSIVLPETWTLVKVSGLNVPQVAPDAGATGTLEFAFTTVPANAAAFSITVHYPVGATPTTARASVILRADGKLTTLNPEGVHFRKVVPDPRRKSEL